MLSKKNEKKQKFFKKVQKGRIQDTGDFQFIIYYLLLIIWISSWFFVPFVVSQNPRESAFTP